MKIVLFNGLVIIVAWLLGYATELMDPEIHLTLINGLFFTHSWWNIHWIASWADCKIRNS
jgi:hypothetical protein